MNQPLPQCRIMRQPLANLISLPYQIQTAEPNWFIRRSSAVLNSSIRFGTWVERRLNRALDFQMLDLVSRYTTSSWTGKYNLVVMFERARIHRWRKDLRRVWNPLSFSLHGFRPSKHTAAQALSGKLWHHRTRGRLFTKPRHVRQFPAEACHWRTYNSFPKSDHRIFTDRKSNHDISKSEAGSRRAVLHPPLELHSFSKRTEDK